MFIATATKKAGSQNDEWVSLAKVQRNPTAAKDFDSQRAAAVSARWETFLAATVGLHSDLGVRGERRRAANTNTNTVRKTEDGVGSWRQDNYVDVLMDPGGWLELRGSLSLPKAKSLHGDVKQRQHFWSTFLIGTVSISSLVYVFLDIFSRFETCSISSTPKEKYIFFLCS